MTSLALWLVGLGGRLTGLVLTTLSVAILARALGPVGRGQYFLFVSFVLVLAALADLGVSQSTLSFSGRRETSLSRIHRITLELAPAAGLAIAIVAIVGFPVLTQSVLAGLPREWYFAAVALVPLALYANFWTSMMVGARRVVETNAVQLAMSALALVANLAFVATTGDPSAAVAVYLAVLAVQAATMFAVASRSVSTQDQSSDASVRGMRLDMIAFGLRGYPNALSTLLWSRAAVFVLNALHGPASVGIYSVAQQLAEKTLVPIQAMQDLIYLRMSQLSRREATATLNRFVRLSVVAIIPTIAVVVVVAPAVVDLLFSEQFSGSVTPLRLLLVGSGVQSVPVLLAPYFLAQLRRPGLLSVLGWANVGFHVLLLVALVPAGAEVGAAAAMVATQVVGTFVVFGLYVRIAQTDPVSSLILRPEDVALVQQQARRLIGR